jgi:hypothetical protein
MLEERPRRRGSTVAAVVVALLMLAGVYGFATPSDPGEDITSLVLIGTSIICFGLLGALVLWRKPGNRMGWVFSAIGIAGVMVGIEIDTPFGLALRTATWMPFFALAVGVLPLLFPTGEPLTPRWRWVLRGLVTFIVVYSLLALVQEEVCVAWAGAEGGQCVEWVDNPIGIPGVENPEYSTLGIFLIALLVVMFVASLVSLILRFRRSEGVERQQIKWLMLAIGTFVALVLFVDILMGDFLGWQLPDPVSGLVDGLAWLSLPVACGLAIFRYRLYEIDRIVSRTVTYGLVVALIALAYGALTIGIPSLVGLIESGVDQEAGIQTGGGSYPLLVAGATLIGFMMFQPLRRRVQTWVDRRFNRSRYDTEKVIDGFAGRLQEVVDPEAVTEAWTEAVTTTMQPTTLGVWLRN